MRSSSALLVASVVALASAVLRAEELNQAALNRFNSEIKAINDLGKERATLKESPFVAMRVIVSRLVAVNTEGLPADLKASFEDVVRISRKLEAVFSDLPEKPDEMRGFMRKKLQEDPKYVDAIASKLAAVKEEAAPIHAKLEEMAKKYGLEVTGLVPGK